MNGTTKWVCLALCFSYFLYISLSFLKQVLLVACVSSVVIHFPNFGPNFIKYSNAKFKPRRTSEAKIFPERCENGNIQEKNPQTTVTTEGNKVNGSFIYWPHFNILFQLYIYAVLLYFSFKTNQASYISLSIL